MKINDRNRINILGISTLVLFIYTSIAINHYWWPFNKTYSNRALATVGLGSSPNDHTGDPLRTAFGKVNAAIDMINNGVDATTVFQAIADSITGKYATKNYVALHTNGGTSWIDSLDVRSSPPASGNVYINSGDKKIHYYAGGYWHRVALKDSIALSDYYGSELVDHGIFDATGNWVIEGDKATITGGVLNINAIAWSQIGYQPISISYGVTYKLEFDITAYTSGTIAVYFGNGDYGSGQDIQYSGTQHVARNITFSGTGSPPSQVFIIAWDLGFVGSIDNVSVMEVL